MLDIYLESKYLAKSNNLWQDEDESYERRNIAYFSQVWNEFIDSMRQEDLISNRFKLLLA